MCERERVCERERDGGGGGKYTEQTECIIRLSVFKGNGKLAAEQWGNSARNSKMFVSDSYYKLNIWFRAGVFEDGLHCFCREYAEHAGPSEPM